MREAPVEPGVVYDVEATRLNDDGEGVASVNGFTVFVPHLLPGEKASITVHRVEKRFARGSIVEARQPHSEVREVPRCGVFGACGGCQLQHLSYAKQLEHKRDMVAYAMARLGKLPDVPVLPSLGMSSPWRYRNQVQVPIRLNTETGCLVQGFFAAGSHEVVETRSCDLQPVEMEATIRKVVAILEEFLGSNAGVVHHLIVRQSLWNGEQMVVLCVRQKFGAITKAAEQISQLPSVVSVARTVQPRPHGPVWGDSVEVLVGKDHLTERIGGIEYLISPRSFFQVNTAQAAVLYETALEYAALSEGDTVLDAYCGTGSMTLLFARHGAKRVLGIEVVEPAVADARANARHNGIDNAEFVVGEVEKVLPQRMKQGERFDVVVLDPPRKGCHPMVLDSLTKAKPKRIVYVSCNHVTLARDLRVLADSGYHVEKVQPVDMFPQTAHVECVASMRRVDK